MFMNAFLRNYMLSSKYGRLLISLINPVNTARFTGLCCTAPSGLDTVTMKVRKHDTGDNGDLTRMIMSSFPNLHEDVDHMPGGSG